MALNAFADNAWRWLSSGLGPSPALTIFIAFVVVAATGVLLALVRVLFAAPILRSLYVILVCPVIEELTCRIFLVGCVMTVVWPCAAPQTTILCGILFGLMHVPTAIHEADPLRVVDGLVIGFFNTIACLVYLRVLLQNAGLEGYALAFLCLVFAHAVYNW